MGRRPRVRAIRTRADTSPVPADGDTPSRTGRLISLPVVVANYEGERYLVAMLGERANWVRNVRAADGRAVPRHGRHEIVRLDEVDPGDRAPILRAYLLRAPGARSLLPVDRRAPLEEFARIADRFPVFHITRPAGDGVEHS